MSVSLPAVPVIEPAIFQMNAASCSSGHPFYELPTVVNLTLDYSPYLAAGSDGSRFSLYYCSYPDGRWTRAPKPHNDPDG
jgi:hypothetical protein